MIKKKSQIRGYNLYSFKIINYRRAVQHAHLRKGHFNTFKEKRCMGQSPSVQTTWKRVSGVQSGFCDENKKPKLFFGTVTGYDGYYNIVYDDADREDMDEIQKSTFVSIYQRGIQKRLSQIQTV